MDGGNIVQDVESRSEVTGVGFPGLLQVYGEPGLAFVESTTWGVMEAGTATPEIIENIVEIYACRHEVEFCEAVWTSGTVSLRVPNRGV